MLNKKTKRIIGGVLLLVCVIQIIATVVYQVFVIPDAIWLVMLVVGVVLMLDVKITWP